MEPFLYHGIKWNNYSLLVKILKSGYIFPRCMLEDGLVTDKNNIFNGTKYISLCQKSLFDVHMEGIFRCSFDEYILNKPALVLKNENIKLIYPENLTMLDKDMMSPEEWRNIIFNDGEKRFSYYLDELQTDDAISLKDNLLAVGIPLSIFSKQYTKVEQQKILTEIKSIILKEYDNIPIVDSSIYNFADDEKCLKKNTIFK